MRTCERHARCFARAIMKRIIGVLATASLLMLAGCINEPSGSGGSGGRGGSGGSGGSGGADLVQCSGQNPTFPVFDKTCTAPSDCFIGLHQVDCCGTHTAIGVRSSEHARFQDDETRCEAMYPGCECAAQPTRAEDGRVATSGAQIVVRCDSNRCMTAVQ